MKMVRLFVSEPAQTSESIHYRLPVRIGRHPHNDCQLAHPGVSRFHVELDWAGDRLLLRDLGTRNGVLVRVAGELHRLHGSELTTAARQVELVMAGIWVRATVEEREAHEVAEVAHRAVTELVEACARAAGRLDGPAEVLAALQRGMVAVRGSLQANAPQLEGEGADAWAEAVGTLVRWTQALSAAVSYLEDVLPITSEESLPQA